MFKEMESTCPNLPSFDVNASIRDYPCKRTAGMSNDLFLWSILNAANASVLRCKCANLVTENASFLSATPFERTVPNKNIRLLLDLSIAIHSQHIFRDQLTLTFSMSHWLVSVPNKKNRSSETTFLELKAETASSRHNYASNM